MDFIRISLIGLNYERLLFTESRNRTSASLTRPSFKSTTPRLVHANWVVG